MRFAMVTCERPTEPDSDLEFVRPALKRKGVTVEAPAWSDPGIDWAGFDLVMVSSTWDYTRRLDDFRDWVARVDSETRLVNPAPMIEWNLDKRYLRALHEQGVPTIPTVWCESGDHHGGLEEADRCGWEELIIKPVVDLGAERLARAPIELAPRILGQLDEPVMIQPFLDSVETEGEVSLVYLDGELAHAIRKTPARGDFRVQPQYGGTHSAITPGDQLLSIGDAALAAAPGSPTYARVDIVAGADGDLQVIELELIEPHLYIDAHPPSGERLARSLLSALAP